MFPSPSYRATTAPDNDSSCQATQLLSHSASLLSGLLFIPNSITSADQQIFGCLGNGPVGVTVFFIALRHSTVCGGPTSILFVYINKAVERSQLWGLISVFSGKLLSDEYRCVLSMPGVGYDTDLLLQKLYSG